jgi:hypothetical protein
MRFAKRAAAYGREFTRITGLEPSFDHEYEAALDRLLEFLEQRTVRPFAERRREFLAHANWKFRLNADRIAALMSVTWKPLLPVVRVVGVEVFPAVDVTLGPQDAVPH